MDTYLTFMGLTLVCLLICSAFFSASEMAITSLNPIKLRMHIEENNKKAIKTMKLFNNYNLTITSIVVGNNIVNILIPTLSTLFFSKLLDNPTLAIFCSSILMSIIMIFFGEIIPKILGKEMQEEFIYKIVDILIIIIKVLYFITQIFIKITNFFEKRFFPKNQTIIVEAQEELLSRVEEGREDGIINESEEELIRNAIEFEEIKVEEIIQPKSNMFCIDVNLDNREIFKLLEQNRYSRIPIYEDEQENIIGILSERDFITKYIEDENFNIRDILRKANFVSDTMLISNLLPQLQADRTHMALVVDEFGTIQGLVTVEDIVEELVGEIWDEHDDVEYPITKINDNVFLLQGSLSIDDFNEFMEPIDKISITSEHEITIAGFIIERLQKIPLVGDNLEIGNLKFIVEKMENNRIAEIKLIIKDNIC